jgi:hypothetical protein
MRLFVPCYYFLVITLIIPAVLSNSYRSIVEYQVVTALTTRDLRMCLFNSGNVSISLCGRKTQEAYGIA